MNFLLIEDEPDYIARVTASVDADGRSKIYAPENVGLKEKFDHGGPVEEQLVNRLRKIRDDYKIDIVLLDTDLSKIGNGIGQVACRQAFQELGTPVCRYTKKQSDTPLSALRDLKRMSVEGASAVWVSGNRARNSDELIPWLRAVSNGFNQLATGLEKSPELLKVSNEEYLGPTGILANLLEKPSLKSDLLGYTAQNFFFFGAPLDGQDSKDAQPIPAQQATRLGYWLLNYILAFPGPILASAAAAAFLNISEASFAEEAVQTLIAKCKYSGPFSELDQYFWKEDLLKLLDELDGDLANAVELKDTRLERVDADNPTSSAYLCLLTNKPIAASDAAQNPDWIPTGAHVARISQELYDELGPMLSM